MVFVGSVCTHYFAAAALSCFQLQLLSTSRGGLYILWMGSSHQFMLNLGLMSLVRIFFIKTSSRISHFLE